MRTDPKPPVVLDYRGSRPLWEDYRRRRRVLAVASVGSLPAIVAVGMPLNWLFGSEVPAMTVALVWMAVFAAAATRMGGFPCPRCRAPFFQRRFAGNPLAQRCMHCGWPKWRERDPAARGDDY